jgi:ABC-type nitrate/sulfonate/bicarbonate transport system substrate-binding protein
MRYLVRHLGVVVLAVALVVSGGAASVVGASVRPHQSGSVTTINFGLVGSPFNLFNLSYYLAQHLGFTAKNGINLNFFSETGEPPAIAAVIGGSLQMTTGVYSLVETADYAGGNLIMVDNEEPATLNDDLVTQPNITTWKDLIGQTAALAGPNVSAAYEFDALITAHGVKPSQVNFTYISSSAACLAALLAKSVASCLLAPATNFTAEADGFHVLAHLAKYFPQSVYSGQGVVAQSSWAYANKKLVEAYIKSYKEAVKWMYNPANAQTIQNVLISGGISATAAHAAYINEFTGPLSRRLFSETALPNYTGLYGQTKGEWVINAFPRSYKPNNKKLAPTTFVDAT